MIWFQSKVIIIDIISENWERVIRKSYAVLMLQISSQWSEYIENCYSTLQRERSRRPEQTLAKSFFRCSVTHNPAKDIKIKREVQPELFLVAINEDMLIGTVVGGFDGYRGWIYYLGVDPVHQRRGIGTSLMKQVESKLLNRGCPKLNLQIRIDNQDVQAFYENLDYITEDLVRIGKNINH
jgi:GNAT superfamily N-acetyltransferase